MDDLIGHHFDFANAFEVDSEDQIQDQESTQGIQTQESTQGIQTQESTQGILSQASSPLFSQMSTQEYDGLRPEWVSLILTIFYFDFIFRAYHKFRNSIQINTLGL